MVITPFGFLYFLLLVTAYIRSFDSLAKIYVISYLFQITSVLNIGSISICPYIIAPILLFTKSLFLSVKKIPFAMDKLASVFVAFCLIHAFFVTNIFTDLKVYASGGMETNLENGGELLHFSMSNIIQTAYLCINFLGLFALIRNRHLLKPCFSTQCIIFATSIVIVLGIWRYVSINIGGWFPSDFLFNSTSYDIGNIEQIIGGRFRFTSIFIEASVAGLCLAISFWAIFILRINARVKYFILSLNSICILLTLSTSGIVTLIIGFLLYSLFVKRNYKTVFSFFIIASIVYAVSIQLDMFDLLIGAVIDKADSQSASSRSSIMYYCWNLFLDTNLIGCGLGSSIGTNIILSMLSQIGIVGFLMLYNLACKIRKYLIINDVAIVCLPLTVLLFGMTMSVGTLSYPTLWMMLAICLCFNNDEVINI